MEVDPDYDEKFEFDAPRYYDFESMEGGTPGDRWFETAPDGPGCKPDKGAQHREPLKPIQDPTPTAEPQVAQEKKKSNIVTTWGQSAGQKTSMNGAGSSKPGGAAGGVAGPSATDAAAAAVQAPVRKSLGVGARRICAPKQDGARTEPPVTRSMSRLGLQLCSPVPEGKACNAASPPMTRSRKCMTAQKAKPSAARTQPMSMQKLRHVLEPKVTKPVRSTKPLTLPDDFELETDKRLANRTGAVAQEQPSKSPFKSLAEKVHEFQAKTPVRFKSKPTKPAPSKPVPPITKAESPQLMTSRRARPPSCKSQAELEAEELERLRKEQFHAKPLDTRVLTSSGQWGVPKVEKPQPTEPRPFNLRSDSRAKVRRSHEHPSMEQAAAAAAFKAQPLKKSILDGPTFKPQKAKVEVTVPKSPLLRTRLRSQAVKAEEQHEEHRTQSQSKQRPASASQSGGLTQPKPFALQTEARGAQHQDQLAAKLAAEEARAKRLRRVTARPLPVSIDVPLVPRKPETKPLTLPDPFKLKSLGRHEEFEERRMRQLQEEEEEARRAAQFKARPMHVGGPFVVHESDMPLTVPEDPDLATEHRAAEREEFDHQVQEKLRQQEAEKRRQDEFKRKQEEDAVRSYRKKLRFSARPMPNFDQPYFAMPSEKPLTNPKTPNFASKKLKKTG